MAFTALMVTAETPKKAEKAKTAKKKVEHQYVGAKKCKMCHIAQYKSWSKTPHAQAFDSLSAADQKKPECVKCHITGKLADGTVLKGVQCEACHGPGKDFKSMKIMSRTKWKADPEKQKKLALAAGLIMPTEKTCVRCHTKEGNPHFKPFDFAKRKLLVHTMNSDKAKSKK
ncbi:MAG: hypothetical protein GXO93_07125 [FCB group bacterium]|nr:hypothetical protein [FCB group bacterium]